MDSSVGHKDTKIHTIITSNTDTHCTFIMQTLGSVSLVLISTRFDCTVIFLSALCNLTLVFIIQVQKEDFSWQENVNKIV